MTIRGVILQRSRALLVPVWAALLLPALAVSAFWSTKARDFTPMFWWAAVGLSLCLLVLFAVFAPHRRIAIALVVVGATILDRFASASFGVSGIVAWAAGTTLVVVAVEIVRQNFKILAKLRREDPSFWAKCVSAVVVWSPMLVFAWGGAWIHDELVAFAEQAVYRISPIDQYCRANPTPVICTGAIGFSMSPERLPAKETLEWRWQAAYAARQQAVITLLSGQSAGDTIPDETFMDDKALLALLVRLEGMTKPENVLALPGSHSVPPDELANSDTQIQQARNRIESLKSRLGETTIEFVARPCRSFARSDPMDCGYEKTVSLRPVVQAEINKVQQDIKNRTEFLQAQLAERFKGNLSFALANDIKVPPPIGLERVFRARNKDEIAIARAALTAFVVKKLADSKLAASTAAYVAIDRAETALKANPTAVQGVEQQLRAIGVAPLCFFARELVSKESGQNQATSKLKKRIFDCDSVTESAAKVLKPLPLHESVELSIQRWHDELTVEVEAASREALVQVVERINDSSAGAKSAGEQVPGSVGFRRNPCYTLQASTWVDCFLNYGKGQVEDGYAERRKLAGERFELAVDGLRDQALKGALPVLDARITAAGEVERATDGLKATVRGINAASDLASTLLAFFVGIALVKSLMYSLALKFYSDQGPAVVRLNSSPPVIGNPPRVAPSGRLRSLTFPDVTPRTPLVTRAYLANQERHNARLPPWPFGSLLARLLHLRYYRYNIGGPLPGTVIAWTPTKNQSVIDWNLAPGESVVFSYRHFEGASKHIRLTSYISFRLDTMLFGRLIFTLASAPNDRPVHLLLSAAAIDLEAVKHDTLKNALVESIIGWHVHTAFQAQLSSSRSALFLDPYSLTWQSTKPPTGRVLVDTAPVQVRFVGLWLFALRVLSPF